MTSPASSSDSDIKSMVSSSFGFFLGAEGGSTVVLHGVKMSHGGGMKSGNPDSCGPVLAKMWGYKINLPMIVCYGSCDLRNSILEPRFGVKVRRHGRERRTVKQLMVVVRGG